MARHSIFQRFGTRRRAIAGAPAGRALVGRRFAGLPVSRWLFALRVWLAIHLALGAAFWIQLDGAESAGVIAAMLALQTRGQIVEKSVCCVLGTVVGGVMSIVIVGLFAQARDLYVVAYSAWLAICVFAAGFLDGNRAYGAVVCGFTVSVVAVIHIDDPNGLFSQVTNRCAAIAIGVASIILIIDVLAGPELGPDLLARIGRGCGTVRAFTDGLLRDGMAADSNTRAVSLLGAASNQHVLLNALPAEAVSGSARAGAVRATLAGLVGEVRAARALAVCERGRRASADPRLSSLVLRRLTGELLARREEAAEAFAAARAGRPAARPPRMPIYRSRENALRNALRAFAASVLTGFAFAHLGWPETSFAWAMVGVVICVSSNAPDPAAMTKGALIGLPAAIVLGGITKFVVLGGVDAFPLLMIGTAPALLATLLTASSPNPALAGIGLLATVYTIVVVSPANPQSYDPQSYVATALLLLVVALLAFVLSHGLIPTSDAQRRRWALASARRDMHAALRGESGGRPEDEARLFDASRIGALAALTRGSPDQDAALGAALRMSDLARAARRIHQALDRPALQSPGPERRDAVAGARAALGMADAAGLRRISAALADTGDEARLTLAADMAEATFQQAQAQQSQAEIDLQRTEVQSPVNGFVTNLLMRVGNYAPAGTPNVSVIDTDSYWIDGYFEETKLGRICVGDRAEAQLMGFRSPILGRVDTITRGIAVSNATASTQGLPSVTAVYTWVRLAQRVPVRIRITAVPPGVPLVSGLTATVTLRGDDAGRAARGPFDGVVASIREVFSPPTPSPDCIPAAVGGTGPEARLPEPNAAPARTPEQIDPGIADGLKAKPKRP